ncbi:MAG: hypothetical protein WBD22_02755 [Pyrinomonadaceae bacterium]
MNESPTKKDLIIDTWEKLDCENVGAAEIIAIEDAVREAFGPQAVDLPMIIARQLADEGAELRHAEIMKLWVDRNAETEYDAIFRSILKFEDLSAAASTIRNLENVRQKFVSIGDKEGLRYLRETALRGKKDVERFVESKKSTEVSRRVATEIAMWLTIWLQTPDVFGSWLEVRRHSGEFISSFGLPPDASE